MWDNEDARPVVGTHLELPSGVEQGVLRARLRTDIRSPYGQTVLS